MSDERFKPKLPIHEISESDFNGGFKRKHLDGKFLKEEDLEAILKIFGLDNRKVDNPTGTINCNEYHLHPFKCNYYYSPEAGIVDRLLNEISNYQSKLKEIETIIQNTPQPNFPKP